MTKAQHARDAAVEATDKAEFQIEVDAYEAILKSVETKSQTIHSLVTNNLKFEQNSVKIQDNM